ncbi:CDGSH iron-sulfur domain-containing protein [Nocardioides nanhaiensis]|uniref:Iron-binding zinc finger CDGSH type domain-containing protein n=1 Tax=Nocardioides nanhaiensis TaxID=1476871 RepID=A0ABP8WC21_9ACTN
MSAPRCAVLLCADGPLVVRGPVTVEDEQGAVHTSERSVVALCRCGLSAQRPWCDGTHKRAGASGG